MKLVVRDQQGQLHLTCPTCRQDTPVPANGVSGLQSAFQVSPLLEILEEHKKAKDSQEEEKNDEACLNPSKKIITDCSEHGDAERQLYCETCEDLICFKCAIKGGKHHNHEYHLLDEAFEKYKGEVVPLLEPMEEKLVAVKEALALLDSSCEEMSECQEAIEADIHDAFGRLQEILDSRKTHLVSQLHKITWRKLKGLAVQEDQMETILVQLSSCLDFVKESLKTDRKGELLMIKTSIIKQVKDLASPFQLGILEPNERADMKFSALQDLADSCQNYGQVLSAGSPDPSTCQVTGNGLEVAVVGEKSTVTLEVVNFEGEPCMKVIDLLQCEFISKITGATERGNIECKEQNQYEISYRPTIKGKHQLSIKVDDTHVKGSPFAVTTNLPVEKLGTPILNFGVEVPMGVAVNRRGQVVVTDSDEHCVSVFSPSGEKLLTFGTHGSDQGQFDAPHGVAVDDEENILVLDTNNYRIQKFTADGQFLSAVGTKGKGPLQFRHPLGIAFNATNKKVYVTDKDVHHIQILNSDFSFSGSFGKKGDGKGQLRRVHGIACDSTGMVYVVDTNNNRIQVFTAEGRFCRVFGKHGDSKEGLDLPFGIAIDGNDKVYISEIDNHRIFVFTSEGQFLTSFGRKGEGPGEFRYPGDIAVDGSGVVYVCDTDNSRIQLF